MDIGFVPAANAENGTNSEMADTAVPGVNTLSVNLPVAGSTMDA